MGVIKLTSKLAVVCEWVVVDNVSDRWTDGYTCGNNELIIILLNVSDERLNDKQYPNPFKYTFSFLVMFIQFSLHDNYDNTFNFMFIKQTHSNTDYYEDWRFLSQITTDTSLLQYIHTRNIMDKKGFHTKS